MKHLNLYIILVLLVTGCKKDKVPTAKEILSFNIYHNDNAILEADIKSSIHNDTVFLSLPNDTISKMLVPTIQVSDGAVVTPASRVAQNFMQPVSYTVKGVDGSIKSYVVISKPDQIVSSLADLKNLQINGVNCAFDAETKTYYYPVSQGTNLSNYAINFDTTNVKYLIFDNLKVKNGEIINYSLATNQKATILANDKFNKSINYNLIITGLPIVKLNANQAIADEMVAANFDLINPDFQSQNSQLELSSKIMISIRGASSRTYPKKSYLVHLVDNDGNDADGSLLGLRSDNSWILDAMYIDQARMRNRVCTDIWNSYNNVPYLSKESKALNGTRGYMTEVFFNDKYWGVYCLTEKLDRKQLQIKKSYGNMYKATDWTNEVQFLGASLTYNNAKNTWGGWQFEYPDLDDTPSPNWSYLYDLINFVATSGNDQFKSDIANRVDLNNMADYFIFMNIIEGFDNQAKNTYISFYDSRNNANFFYSPWDLDGTLGRNWDGSYLSNSILGSGPNNLFKKLISLNPQNFKQLVKARWNNLKLNQLAKTSVNLKIDGYKNKLANTGAFDRERSTWKNISQDLNTETTYIKNWYSAQYDLLDSYINNL